MSIEREGAIPSPAAPAAGEYVRIFDTTLRDGEQAPGCTMTREEKLQIARQLQRMGVDIIEAGFPAASRGDWDAVNAIAGEIGQGERAPMICGLARANEAFQACLRQLEAGVAEYTCRICRTRTPDWREASSGQAMA